MIDINIRIFSTVSHNNNGGNGGNFLGNLLGQPGPNGQVYVDTNNQGNNGCPGNEPANCRQPRCSERLRQARVSASTLRGLLTIRLIKRRYRWQ